MKIPILISIGLTISLNAFAAETCPLEAIAVKSLDYGNYNVPTMFVESSVGQETFLYTDAGKLTNNFIRINELASQAPITEGSTKNLPKLYFAGSLQDRYSAVKILCGAGTVTTSYQGKYKGDADLWNCYKSCP